MCEPFTDDNIKFVVSETKKFYFVFKKILDVQHYVIFKEKIEKIIDGIVNDLMVIKNPDSDEIFKKTISLMLLNLNVYENLLRCIVKEDV